MAENTEREAGNSRAGLNFVPTWLFSSTQHCVVWTITDDGRDDADLPENENAPASYRNNTGITWFVVCS